MSGQGDEFKGKLKKAAGDLTDDKELRREGRADELAGKAKGLIDRIKDRLVARRKPSV